MLKNKKKKSKELMGFKNNNILKIIVIILIFMLLIVGILSMRSAKPIPKKIMPNKDNISELFNNIKDNYTLEIDKNIDGVTSNIIYSRDKNLILFEGEYEADGYLVYKDKVYEINANNQKLSKSKLSIDKIEDKYYDIELIKSLFGFCEPEYITNVKALCKIKYSDYLDTYNNKYNTKIESKIDGFIELYVVHYADRIGKIIIDYTDINRIINNSNVRVDYGILIKDIDKNDFSDYLNYYKKVLTK